MAKRNSGAAGWVVFLIVLALVGGWLLWVLQHPRQRNAGPAAAPAPSAITSVRIGTWNIRHFGDRADLDLPQIARIIEEAALDVLAIQEVKSDGRAVDRLLATLGHPWRGAEISPMTGNSERFAFVYRGDRVQQLSPAASISPQTPDVFARLPYTATFRAGNFDFQLISVHLSYADVSRRRLEVQALAEHVLELAARQAEKDIVVLGDFNEQKARPNFDFFTAAGWAVSVKDGTNLSSRETYDNILYHPGYTPEWRGAVVVPFDENYFGNDDAAAARLSDHRPIYADFDAAGKDDD